MCHLVATRDLARLYECKNGTKTINQAVNRNFERFPEDFYFQLTKKEFDNLKSQFGTSSWSNYGGVRKLPYVFTEQGVAMLSSVLRTEVAAKVSINIMRAFVSMRNHIANLLVDQKHINSMVLKHETKIDLILDKLEDKEQKNNHIFFEGQIYDAYSLLIDILNRSKEEIIVIDNYAGKELLDILKDINKNIIIISKNISEELINKYNKQYSNINFIYNDSFHDRFIIIDRKILYHSGSSFKDLGKKCFCISIIYDSNILNGIIEGIGGINELL